MTMHSQTETQICLSSAFSFFRSTFVCSRSITRSYNISIINVCINIIIRINVINVCAVSVIAIISIIFFLPLL